MRICCAGEVMVEMVPTGQAAKYCQGAAGDSFNTAIYLARAGLEVEYLTRIGDDALSDTIIARARLEGIGDSLMERCAGRQPGLYLIANDESGEREFSYWRDQSPARELFDQVPALPELDAFYFTGITLAVSRSGLDNLVTVLENLRENGATIVFDPNFRPRLWRDRQQAQEHYDKVLPLCDMVLPTLEDEAALWGTGSVEDCRAFYAALQTRELVIKGGALKTHVFSAEGEFSQQAQTVKAIDTTGAGDAFNAGYLSRRLSGHSIEESVCAAQQLSAIVVQHRGAIAPPSSTKSLGF
jgi:2-dehydro-3-deoxygluconokinase